MCVITVLLATITVFLRSMDNLKQNKQIKKATNTRWKIPYQGSSDPER